MSIESAREQIVQNQAEKSQTAEAQTADSRVINASSDFEQALRRAMLLIVGLVMAAVIAFWGAHTLGTSDPYIHSVLEISGDAGRGRDIFQLNCATCHGLEEVGEVGPDLHNVSERKSRVGLIEQVISGKTPPMPQFQPNAKDMADLLSFLETL